MKEVAHSVNPQLSPLSTDPATGLAERRPLGSLQSGRGLEGRHLVAMSTEWSTGKLGVDRAALGVLADHDGVDDARFAPLCKGQSGGGLRANPQRYRR